MNAESTLYEVVTNIALQICPRVYGYKYTSDSDEMYFEIFETEITEIPQKSKNRELGEISITIHAWGDQYSRYEVSDILEQLKKRTDSILSGGFIFRQLKKKTFQTIMGDTSQPKKTFTHGVLVLTFNYSN